MRAIALALFGFAIAAGCVPSVIDLAPFPCAADGTCPEGLACGGGKCVTPEIGQSCVEGKTDCGLGDGVSCKLDVCVETNPLTCAPGYIFVPFEPPIGAAATRDGACFVDCTPTNTVCPHGLACQGFDATHAACIGANVSFAFFPCSYGNACPAGSACFDGLCARRCDQDADCPPSLSCFIGYCVARCDTTDCPRSGLRCIATSPAPGATQVCAAL